MGKQDRDEVFREVESHSQGMIWKRDDVYFSWFERWFTYAEYVRILRYNIYTDWDKDKRQSYIDTAVFIIGKDHTCEVYKDFIRFDNFYKGKDMTFIKIMMNKKK